MNIANLDYLETISEAPRVVGAFSQKFLSFKEKYSGYKGFSISKSWETEDGSQVDLLVEGGYSQTEGGSLAFASASSSVTSP